MHKCIIISYNFFFFFFARDNETIRDWLTSGKSPLAQRVSYCLFCVLKNGQHSHRQSPVFPIRWFICGGPQQYPPAAAISSRVSQYLATFRPFWRLFFPYNRYMLTNLATSLKKKLGRCLQYCPASASSDSLRLLSSERQRNIAFSWPQRSKIVNKTAFPSTCRLLTVWSFKYEHNSSVNMLIVCYSDAGSALNDTKQ